MFPRTADQGPGGPKHGRGVERAPAVNVAARKREARREAGPEFTLWREPRAKPHLTAVSQRTSVSAATDIAEVSGVLSQAF